MNDVLPDAAIALSNAWGCSVKLHFAEKLSENRPVARLNVLSSSSGLPKTAILKACRKEGDEGFDANYSASEFLNEWASMEFMAQLFGKSVLSPEVYTGDREKGFLIIEDLPEGSTFEKILNGENLAKAEDALRLYGENLGKLHGQTLGQLEAFQARRKRFGFSDGWKPFEPLGYLESGLKTLETLKLEVHAKASRDIEDAAALLSRIEGWTVLHHGDPAPNNVWIDPGNRLYFIDFESARFDHALLEAVNPRMGFPTWGMFFVNRIPEKNWREAETAYLTALAKHCPQAADATVYGPILAASCASWTIGFCGRWLQTAMLGEIPVDMSNRLRQIALGRIDSFVQAAQEFDYLPALGESFSKLSAYLRSQWPAEAHELPLFPAFV